MHLVLQIFLRLLFTARTNNIQKEVIFIKKTRKILKATALVLLTFFLIGTVSAGALAASFFVYLKNIDAELDIDMLAGNLGLTTKIYHVQNGEEGELLRPSYKPKKVFLCPLPSKQAPYGCSEAAQA